MLLEHIRFENRLALKIEIKNKKYIDQALQSFGLGEHRSVIVIIGGAGGVREEDWKPIRKVLTVIAKIAQEKNAVVIDGGTHSGVMAAIGEIRKNNEYNFPLIGIAADGTVNWPGRKLGIRKWFPSNRKLGPLDPNHTHFILVPGNNWGDESSWIADVATRLAGEYSSLAVLINGGTISREKDVPYNLKAGRPVYVIEGTGRAADEFAAQPPDTKLMQIFNVHDLNRLQNELNYSLKLTE